MWLMLPASKKTLALSLPIVFLLPFDQKNNLDYISLPFSRYWNISSNSEIILSVSHCTVPGTVSTVIKVEKVC